MRAAGSLTVKDYSRALFTTDKPTPNEVEKARRKLDALVRKGSLVKADQAPGDKSPATYHAPEAPITAPITAREAA